jgi:hypothetical protein
MALAATVLLAGAAGCGGSGDLHVSKSSRARILADAGADGKVTLPKARNPRKPAAGLRTVRALLENKDSQ